MPTSAARALVDVPVQKEVIGTCAGCFKVWNKYRGRKRCPVCGVPLLLCFDCIKSKADKVKRVKCNLCREDGRLGRKPFNKREHKMSIGGMGNECGDEEDEDDDNRSCVSNNTSSGKRSLSAQCVCGVCSEEFKSRNLLFKHIKDTGHANRKAKKTKTI